MSSRSAVPASLSRRSAFSLIELLVVIGILAVILTLLLPAVQRVRATASRAACQSNLKQIGIALHGFHDGVGYLPPGMLSEESVTDSYHTGFTYLLPYLDQANVEALYDYTKQWYDSANYVAAAQQVLVYYCPANRARGTIDMTPYIQQWGCAMPPVVGASDYVLCKGPNAGLYYDPTLIPTAVRGLFNVVQSTSETITVAGGPNQTQWGMTPAFRIRLTDISDGSSSTLAVGEAAGGNPYFLVEDVNNLGQPVAEPFVNGPAVMDQAWAVASLGDPTHPWYAGIFGVTAQFGMGANPVDEPMNRRPGKATLISGDHSGYNLSGNDQVSGFRSLHPGGCNFLLADGSVRFVMETIDPTVYRALSTYAGGEAAALPD